MCPVYAPGGGNDPPPPGQGPVWATQGPVWQKRKKTAQPGKQPPAQMENTPAFDLPPGERFPQKISSGERCEKRAGERPGVAHRRPVPGHFARQSRSFRDFSQASISPFSGVGWRPWGHGRGQKTRNSRRQAIFPGVTAGVSERMKKSMAEKDLKRKFALWIRPSLLEEVDSLYESDNCASRSEFMEKALRFYMGYLSSQKNQDYLAHVIPATVKGIWTRAPTAWGGCCSRWRWSRR